MLCFIIPLKAKVVANDWVRVSQLFEQSLCSAYKQVDPDFHIIVVCHDMPTLQQNYDARVEFLQVDFPPPDMKRKQVTTMQDKWRKVGIGMVRAGQINPDFVMIMDADDLVSRRLSQWANAHKDTNGWILETGYKYQYGSHWAYLDHKFNCGTNAIVSSKLIKFPHDPVKDRESCVVLRYGHTVIKQHLIEAGTPLAPLPFPGAVYVIGHGDNWTIFRSNEFIGWCKVKRRLGSYYRFLKTLPEQRFLTRRLREEYSLSIR